MIRFFNEKSSSGDGIFAPEETVGKGRLLALGPLDVK